MKAHWTISLGLCIALFCSCSQNTPSTDEIIDELDLEVAVLLFDQSTENSCAEFATIHSGEFIIENNTWNASNLPNGSFSQCIYKYDENNVLLMGWEWQYPNDAFGVNAYPQIIYGWKPWLSNSTTQNLPVKIQDINSIKANYDVNVERNIGDYNLAFDNWINSSSAVTPQNIQFEFMIWEESNGLVPFGDFQEVVSTSNGDYRFYMGEPDWEPAGSNWTYLAFSRVQGRQSGTVDIDELLAYLISQGIVSDQSYLGSIEFGNEIGNSTGRTIIENFEININ